MKTSVRLLAVLFALIMVVCTVALAADYSDLEATHKNYEAIELLTTLGILDGYEDGTFLPAAPVQRDEMAKMIYIMSTTYTDAGTGVQIFPDVSAKHWAAGFISWCSGKNIVAGYEDGTFRPDDNITYDEALKMACAMIGYDDFSSELWPTDVRHKALIELGLDKNLEELQTQIEINGELVDTIAGDQAITRAQAAQIIFNCFYKIMHNDNLEPFYREDMYIEQDEFELLQSQKTMTLADDVWDCDVLDYVVVATENYAVYDEAKNIKTAVKTGEEDVILVWTAQNGVEEFNLTKLGLDSYIGNTDALLGLTVTKITKAGKDFAITGVKGQRFDTVTYAWVGAKAGETANYCISGTTYWYADRMVFNGVTYMGEDFTNLRAVYAPIGDDTVFHVMDRPIACADAGSPLVTPHNDNVSYGSVKVGNTFTLDGVSYPITYTDREVDMNTYYQGYGSKHAWGVDSDGDTKLDYVFLKYNQLYQVSKVAIVTEQVGGETVTDVRIDFFDVNAPSKEYHVYKSNVKSPVDLKEGDVFTGAPYGNKLYVETVIEPQVTSVNSVNTSGTVAKLGLEGLGSYNVGYNFVGNAKASISGGASIFPYNDNDVVKEYISDKNGVAKQLEVWIYNSAIVKTNMTVTSADDNGYKTAILLYADAATNMQFNRATKKYEVFYPAYLLINGKEEAVNLCYEDAINGATAKYVSAEKSPYRATVDNDSILHNVYMLVTYKVDANGYYTLRTDDVATKYDGKGTEQKNVLEEVLVYDSDSKNLEFTFNKVNKLFYINDMATGKSYKAIMDDSSYLYYTYEEPEKTGAYKYIGFYTSDSFTDEGFDPVLFASNVYLSYNPKTQIYTIKNGILAGRIENAVGTEGFVDYKKDARAIVYAASETAVVKFNDEAHYMHNIMNPLTGEIKSEIQEIKSVSDGAIVLLPGHFYAWDAQAKDYVEVGASLNSIIESKIEDIDLAESRIYTVAGSEFESGIKLPEDFKFIAFDDKKNRIELTLADVVNIKEMYDFKSDKMDIFFFTHLDENDEVQYDYAIVDYAEAVEKDDGSVDYVPHSVTGTVLNAK